MNRKTIHTIILALTVVACSPTKKEQPVAVKRFSLPEVPAMLVTPEQKTEFIATHYWDNFDFSDTTLISRTDITEQAFADFVNMLSIASPQLIDKGATALMGKASADSAMYAHFVTLSEKYLYDPNSPLRNEDIYIAVLKNIIANETLDDSRKIRPRYQLRMALRNRKGDKATDFAYTTPTGSKARLYQAKGDPLLLFFYRPECETCKSVKEYIANREIDKQVKILFVNPDTDVYLDTIYDLRASPVLYLLDKNKKVLLKDASIEVIEQELNIGLIMEKK